MNIYMKKISSIGILFVSLFLLRVTPSFAGDSYFSITPTPTETDVSFTVSYTGSATTPATIEVSGIDGYYKDETYTAEPGKSVQRTYTGLTPNKQYYILVFSTDEQFSNNTQYVAKQGFKTVKPTVQIDNGTGTSGSGTGTGTGNNGSQTPAPTLTPKTHVPATTGSGFALNVKINNPLKVDTIQGAIKLFMDAVLRIAIPFIVIFFIWSGLSFILARGNPTKLVTARKMFWYTIIGTLLILGAWTITNAIIGTVNTITG
jgi:hypothetical protein